MTLIRRDEEGARVVDDGWRALGDDEAIPAEGEVVVSLARWRRDRDALRGRRVGVLVPGETAAEELASDVDGLSLVVVHISKFSDGRAYTLARLLRTRFGYEGELRASGDVLRDQLFYLARCGFTSFELAPGRDVGDALAAFADFSVTYQPAADHDQPIWRRRTAES